MAFLKIVKKIVVFLRFECLPSAQGGEFGVTWDYFITTLAILPSTDGNIFWGSREECMFGQQEQEELQCGDYKV